MTIEITRGAADWNALHALLTEAFAFMEGRIDPPSSLHHLDPAGLAEKAGAEILLTAHDPALVGCVFLAAQPPELHVGKLAIRPTRQGRGIGRLLIRAAEVEAHRLGLTALTLQTRIELTENHTAFAAMGFVKMAETAHPGFDRPTAITMRKPVAPAVGDDTTRPPERGRESEART